MRSKELWLERGSALQRVVRMLYHEAHFIVVVRSQLPLLAGSGVSVWQHCYILFGRAFLSLHAFQKACFFLGWIPFPKWGIRAVKVVMWKPLWGYKCSSNLEKQCLISSSHLNVFCWSTLVNCLAGCIFPRVALTFQFLKKFLINIFINSRWRQW